MWRFLLICPTISMEKAFHFVNLSCMIFNSERSKRRGLVFVSSSLYITAAHVFFSSRAVSSHVCSTFKNEESVSSRSKTFASNSITLLSTSTNLLSVLPQKKGGRERSVHRLFGGYTGFFAKNVLEVRFSVNTVGVLGVLRSACTKVKSEKVQKRANLAII